MIRLTIDEALGLIAERIPKWDIACRRCKALSGPRRTWQYRWIWLQTARESVGLFSEEEEAAMRAVALARPEDLESVQAGDGGALYVLCEEVADHILWIKGLALRLETLEGAVEAVSRLAISLSQKLAADWLKSEQAAAVEACRKVAERVEP